MKSHVGSSSREKTKKREASFRMMHKMRRNKTGHIELIKINLVKIMTVAL